MIYLDTNVLIYAFCKDVDDLLQKERSQEILRSSILNGELIVSEILLYEFAFVSKKLDEDVVVIDKNLEFLSKYLKYTPDVVAKAIKLICDTQSYRDSFDIYHLTFANHFKCDNIFTFDSGFKKFKKYSKAKITIL